MTAQGAVAAQRATATQGAVEPQAIVPHQEGLTGEFRLWPHQKVLDGDLRPHSLPQLQDKGPQAMPPSSKCL